MTLPRPRLQLRPLSISADRVEMFEGVVDHFGVEETLVSESYNPNYGTSYTFRISARVSWDHEEVVAMITSLRSESEQRLMAGILYNMYATGNLVLVGHQYPRYTDWRNEQALGMTLDHILPRQYYPELTFEVSNWQALTRAQNEALGSAIDAEDISSRMADRAASAMDELTAIMNSI